MFHVLARLPQLQVSLRTVLSGATILRLNGSFARLSLEQLLLRFAVMFPFWMDFTASSLTSLLVTLAATLSVLLSVFAPPR